MHKHTGTGRDADDTRGTGGFTRGGGICATRIGGGRDENHGGGWVAGRVGNGG